MIKGYYFLSYSGKNSYLTATSAITSINPKTQITRSGLLKPIDCSHSSTSKPFTHATFTNPFSQPDSNSRKGDVGAAVDSRHIRKHTGIVVLLNLFE